MGVAASEVLAFGILLLPIPITGVGDCQMGPSYILGLGDFKNDELSYEAGKYIILCSLLEKSGNHETCNRFTRRPLNLG